MNRELALGLALSLFVIAVLPLDLAAEEAGAPSIEGTYRLVSRELPDGTMQVPPDVMGLITFTGSHRNFSILWKEADGRLVSISYAASYGLSAKEYSETSVFRVSTLGKEVTYDISAKSGTSPVTSKDGRVEFQLPLYDEPRLVFEGDEFRAITPGFVDNWERVE